MKLRIKGNMVRLRLTKSEVDYFSIHKKIEETVDFPENNFVYSLNNLPVENIEVSFDNNKLSVNLPSTFAEKWVTTNLISCSGEMRLKNGKSIYLLIEKDFKCLDETVEDQSDNYENPLALNRK